MTDLFEFKYETKPEGLDIKEFKQFLNDVWQKYKEEKPQFWREKLTEEDEDTKKKQPFLYFEENKLKSKNYIGFIKYKDFSFNLYPKICPPEYNEQNELTNKEQINNMLLLWLQYSNDTLLPNIETSLESNNISSFIDILIYLFAKYTSDLLSVSIYQHYEEISEETNFLKGKLNFTEYIKNCASGKAHKFHCTYDSFEVNNKFNQIIKYVSKSLYQITSNPANQNYLQDIIYTLDEVDDVVCTYNDCESVYINRFMGEFTTVLDYCKLFLSNSVTFNEFGEFDNFAFLLRTELLFEDFISNLGAELTNNKIELIPQSIHKLDKNGRFNIKPDLIIKENKEITKIIDIKYKDINCNSKIDYDSVKQADIYQCVTYASKLKCNDVTLLYPSFNKTKELEPINIEGITINFKFIDCYPDEDIEITKNNIKGKLEKILNINKS